MANYVTTSEKMTAIADAIREKDGSTALITDTQMPDKIRALSGIPGYITEEATRVASIVSNKQNSNTLTFMAMSDAHYMTPEDGISDAQRYISVAVKHAGQGMAKLRDIVDIDMAVLLGDNSWGASGKTTVDDGINEIRSVNQAIDTAYGGLYNLRTPGNHDTLVYNYDMNGGDYLDREELFHLFGIYNNHVVTPGADMHRGYCYRDFEKQKIRAICLNTCDLCTTEEGGQTIETMASWGGLYMSGQQLKWFAETLNSIADKPDSGEWGVLIFSHHPLDHGAPLIYSCDILKAYIEGKSVSRTHTGVSYNVNFNGRNNAKIIAAVHGHNHNYLISDLHYLTGQVVNGVYQTATIPVKRVGVPNACFIRNNERGSLNTDGSIKTDVLDIDYGEYNPDGTQMNCAKTMNSATDTSFAVFTVDTYTKQMYIAYYGARPEDERIISYGDEVIVYYSITRNLNNVSLNNSTNSIAKGLTYSATITPNSGYKIGTITVTMGGTDITSSAYSNGKVNISSVTGDVVITATAVALKAYTINPTLNNCIASGSNPTTITEGGTATLKFTANTGYELSDTVSVTGASYTWDKTTGTLILSVPTADVNVNVTAVVVKSNYNNLIETVGYVPDTYLSSSSGTTSGKTGYGTLNMVSVPAPTHDAEGQVVIYLKNVEATTSDLSNTRFGFYDANGTNITIGSLVAATEGYTRYKINYWVEDGYINKIDLSTYLFNNPNVKQIRFSAKGLDGDSIITLNEPITQDTPTLAYTNVLPTAQVFTAGDSSVLDGVGYKDNHYQSSNGGHTAGATGYTATGLIPYSRKSNGTYPTIYVMGCTFEATSQSRIYLFGADQGSYPKNIIFPAQYGGSGASPANVNKLWTKVDHGSYWSFVPTAEFNAMALVNNNLVGFVGMSLKGKGADLIITLDEPIE